MGFGLSKEKAKAITDAFTKMEEDRSYSLDLSTFFIYIGGKYIGD